ncbi:MAG: hypothetical protein K0Q72_3812 [Armatimonadetes bacterium]|jgi:hypothetical protein|nr:hypothetical protein [Armatimonadota bacterium]
MRSPIRVLLAVLTLGIATEVVMAQQFYNPSRYHNTRQSLTNRTITRRLGRHPKRKVVKRGVIAKRTQVKSKSTTAARSR